jgi:hypothetical protein
MATHGGSNNDRFFRLESHTRLLFARTFLLIGRFIYRFPTQLLLTMICLRDQGRIQYKKKKQASSQFRCPSESPFKKSFSDGLSGNNKYYRAELLFA